MASKAREKRLDAPYNDYSVSDDGVIRSYKFGKCRILHVYDNNIGYLQTELFNREHNKWFLVHRLVAQYFCDNPHGYVEVNHIDMNKQNNHYTNLEWTTRLKNCYGVTGFRKVTENDVREIRANVHGLSRKALAAKYGINESNIYKIRARKSWRHVE